LQHVEQENWARLTSDVAETMGASAKYVSPEIFGQQMECFSKYIHTKAPYFTVVYEAYRAEAFEQARIAARVAAKRWPNEQNMEREVKYLDDLIEKRKKLLESYKAQQKPRPTIDKSEPVKPQVPEPAKTE
jgi:hypothetical protein